MKRDITKNEEQSKLDSKDAGAGAFKSNHTILDLNLGSCGISSLGAGQLAGDIKITKLVLRGNNIGDQGAAAFYNNPFITELDLSNCGIGEQGALQLADTKTITRLNLEDNKIGDRGAAAFQTNRSITELNLRTCSIGSQGAIELSKNRAITSLRLNLNAIGDAGAAAFKDNTTLIKLHMMDCKITYRGAIELAKNKTIKTLDLTRNVIGDAGAVAFIDNTSLTELGFFRTGISDRGLSALTLNQSITRPGVDEYSRRIMTSLAGYFLLANQTRSNLDLPDLLFLSDYHPSLVKEINKIPFRNHLFQQEYPVKVREEIIEFLGINVLTDLVWEYAEGEFPYQYGLLNKIPGGQEAINHLCETVPGLRNRFDCQPGKFEDWEPLDPVETEYFSEFAKKDNGTDMLGLRIRTIETVDYLLKYLNLNPVIKKLFAVIFCAFDEAVSLLAGNKTLTSLILYCAGNYDPVSLDKGLEALSSNRSLTHLRIEATMDPVIFSHEKITQLLKNNTVLKSLELNNAQIDNDVARTLFSCPNLEKLSFRFPTFTLDDHHLLNSHLHTLHLAYIKKQSGDDTIRILSNYPSLTNLRLDHCKISNGGVDRLLELKTLRILDLRDNKINNQGLRILSKHPNINELTLKEEHISYQGIKFFLKKKKKILKSFAYHGEQQNRVMNNWVTVFSGCSVLTSLTLRKCGIGPKATALISKNKNLEHLDLSHNFIADKGARHLASHPRLNSLYVEDCKIGDRGITALVKNPRLKRLAISSNSEMTCIGLLALALNNTITELDFNYERLMTSKLVLFFLCNQTLRYCTPYTDSSYYCFSGCPSNENDPLIALGEEILGYKMNIIVS